MSFVSSVLVFIKFSLKIFLNSKNTYKRDELCFETNNAGNVKLMLTTRRKSLRSNNVIQDHYLIYDSV